MIPKAQPKNGKEVVCVGAGPASLTVARDLASQGYAVTVYDGETKAGGFIRSQIPRFRLPGRVAAADHIHIGIDWLASVSFGHVTAMDCCRSARWHPGQQRPCAASLCD